MKYLERNFIKISIVFIGLLIILSIPLITHAQPLDIPQLIAKEALNDGIDVHTALYISYKESTWNPAAIGDHGTSYGIWQIHNPQSKGLTLQQAIDPVFSTKWAMKTMVKDGSCKEWSTCPASMSD